MQHALALARKGIGLVSPNPVVGCVIVREGQIVGEGFHQYDWRDHAEIVALKSAGDKARGATLYVTLEPILSIPARDSSVSAPQASKSSLASAKTKHAASMKPSPAGFGRRNHSSR